MAINGVVAVVVVIRKCFGFPVTLILEISCWQLLFSSAIRWYEIRKDRAVFFYWKRVWPVKNMYMFHSLQSSVVSTLREELPIGEKNAQDHFWKTKTKTAKNWSRGAKTGELQHRINPAVDRNSYTRVKVGRH